MKLFIKTAVVLCLFFPFDLRAEPLRVGISAPLSGKVAPMGTAFKNGVELFVKDNAETAGRAEFIYDDHRYDGKQVLSSLRFLKDQKKADVVVLWGNTPTEVAAPLAESMKLPILAITMSPHGKNRDLVVTLGNPIEKSLEKIKSFFEDNKAKHPGVVYVNLGNALQALEDLNKMMDGKLFTELVDENSSDFRSLISKLKSRGVDALLVFLLPEQSIAFAKQASALKYQIPVIGGDVWADEAVTEELIKYLPKVSYVYGAVEKDFLNRYRKVYGNTSYIFEAASGYQAASILSSLPRDWKKQEFSELIEASSLNDSVLTNLKLEKTEEFGLHLFAEARIYNPSRN